MPTLEDVFVIPQADDLSALDFVIRLDAAAREGSVQRLVDDYVVTPAVADALPTLFGHMKQAVTRGEAYGHILHGGFGSGKSHLMSMISLLLERNPVAWGKDHPTFEKLRAEHRDWVAEHRLLVVRVHMLSARRAGAGLDDILYDAVNRALAAQGKAPLLVSGAAEVLAEIRNQAALYGDLFWKRAAAAGVGEGPEDLLAAEEAGEEAVAAVAEAYLAMNGRSLHAEGLKPAWGEGIKRLAKHVRAQGFGGVAFLVDEFLLWLAEKAGEDFVSAINDMNSLVDFSGRREVPVLVVFARQRNIKEFFPDLTNQDRIQERIDHHANRFEVTKLKDVELRYIVAGRVLRQKKDPAAIDAAIAELQVTYKRALDDLLGESGVEILRDVYPFHPALIDVLVDVSNLMQRERSALRLLYEMLAHSRTLPLGHLLPVGRAFDHVFPEAGVEAAQKTETLQKIHQEWYQRLRLRVDAFVANKAENGDPVSEERATTLKAVIKTVLLGLVSPRLAGKGNERLTVERLVKLNFADADGELLRVKINRLSGDLTDFQTLWAPELQVTGEKGAAVVSYALGQASLAEVLRRAEEKVRNDAYLKRVLGTRLDRALPKALAGLVQAADGLPYDLLWRGTRRRGRVLFGNVRTQTYSTFEPGAGEAFRLVVDYPWDDPGHNVGEDIQLVAAVRKSKGTRTSAAWLPRHFSTQEERLLRELAAAQWVVDEGASSELLANYGRDERTLLLEQARNRVEMLQRQVDAALLEAYDAHGQVKALIGAREPDLGTGNLAGDLDQVLRELLDRRYPQHPDYKVEATRARVGVLEKWMREAWGQAGSVHFDAETGSVLEHVGRPLEIADVGQSRASIEHHGRFIKEVVAELGDHRTVPWGPLAERLRDTPFGLTDEVIDLLLVYVCLRGYRLRDPAGDRVEPKIGLGNRPITLEKAELLDLAPWSRARALAQQVLRLPVSDAHRSLSAQDKLAHDAGAVATRLRDDLGRLFGLLDGFGVAGSERHAEVKGLIDRLAPLVKPGADSFQTLTAFLAVWPDDDASLRAALAAVQANVAALQQVDSNSRGHLLRGRAGWLAPRIDAVLDELEERLRAREQVRPLRSEDVARFNREAAAIVAELIAGPAGGTVSVPGVPSGTMGRGGAPAAADEEITLDGRDPAEVDRVLAGLAARLRTGELVSLQIRARRAERGG